MTRPAAGLPAGAPQAARPAACPASVSGGAAFPFPPA